MKKVKEEVIEEAKIVKEGPDVGPEMQAPPVEPPIVLTTGQVNSFINLIAAVLINDNKADILINNFIKIVQETNPQLRKVEPEKK